MPVQLLAIFVSLLLATFAVTGLAMLSGAELYCFYAGISFGGAFISKPPTPPEFVFFALGIIVAVIYISPHYSLVGYSLLAGSLALGCVIGLVFGWTPSWAQILLTIVAVGSASYGWSQHEYLDY